MKCSLWKNDVRAPKVQITIDGALDPNWRQSIKEEEMKEDYLALKKDALRE